MIMGNVVSPSFSSQAPSVNVKTYGYGGKTVTKPQLFEYTDMPEIDYSQKPKKSKGIHTTIPVEQIDTRLRIGASIVNTGVSLVKGFTSFGEALVDTVALAGGAVASVVTGVKDIGDLIYAKATGKTWAGFNDTKALWSKHIMPFVGKNYTEKIFDKIYYDTAFGQDVEHMAFNCCKKNGVICEITEGVGYYTGVIALAFATGGVSSLTPAVAHGLSMGGAAIGRNAQSGYNNLSESEKYNSKSLGKVVGISTVTGAVEGLTYAIGVSGANKLYGYMTNKGFNLIGSKVAKAGFQAVVKSMKPIINEGVESAAYGTKYDFREVGIQVGSVFASEAVGAVVETKLENTLTAKKTAQQLAAKYAGAKNGQSIANSATDGAAATQAYNDAMDEYIIYAGTEWAEGATQSTVVEAAEELEAA